MSVNITKEQLIDLLEISTSEQLKEIIYDIHPVDVLDGIDDYDGNKYLLLNKLPLDYLADIIDEAEYEDKYEILQLFPTHKQKMIIKKMASDQLVDLLETISPEKAKRLIEALDEEDAEDVKELMTYHPETAGGIMATEFAIIKEDMTVEDTLEFLRRESENIESANYLYVLDHEQHLKGVVSLRDIATSDPQIEIAEIMNENVISIPVDMDQELVGRLFQKYGLSSMPVIDEDNKMLGIITSDDIMDVLRDENTEDFEKMAALIHHEDQYLETSVINLAKKRITWLLFLMISATFTGIIIQGFEEALASVVILAAFIPMLMDTGGNAGSQTATLIIRGMALGEVELKNVLQVLFKELRVSIIVGFGLAVINYFRIILLDGTDNHLVALTVSIALMLTIIIAKTVGCVLPIFAKLVKGDPAIMAAPIITTIVDALSLMIYFTLATWILKIG